MYLEFGEGSFNSPSKKLRDVSESGSADDKGDKHNAGENESDKADDIGHCDSLLVGALSRAVGEVEGAGALANARCVVAVC